MPSVSNKQHNAMEAAAHGHSTLGIPKSVGQEFASADKGRSFSRGGAVDHEDRSERTRNASNNEYKAKVVEAPKQGPKLQLDSDWGPPALSGHNPGPDSFADGGPVGMGISPAAGTSATLPPPPGQRTPARRFYGKR